jgi:hypothetical protein
MATRLDQEIERLERLVEKHLDLCAVTSNGMRCTLPRSHGETMQHKFAAALPTTTGPQTGVPKSFCGFDELSELCRLCLLLFETQETSGAYSFDA